MSLSITGVSNASAAYDAQDASEASKQATKPTTGQQVSQLAESGHSAAQIATALGLSKDIVEEDLGETSATSSSTGAAAALVSANSRLSVSA